VVLEVDAQNQQGPLSLKGIYVPTASGGPVPLDTVASIEQRPTALTINHLGQFPTTTISFNLAKGAALGRRWRPSVRPRPSWACRPAWIPSSRARRWPSRLRSATRCG
jgi:hypothetical protein